MGSPLGPLMANDFLCHLEDKLTRDGVMPTFYKRYVDDTLVRMPSTDAAVDFLTTLNSLHPSLSFTMELRWIFDEHMHDESVVFSKQSL